jgi:hypothetical protein
MKNNAGAKFRLASGFCPFFLPVSPHFKSKVGNNFWLGRK